MLNAARVNAGGVNAFRRVSCGIDRDSGRIPRFKNPVKYKAKSPVNHETVHFAGVPAARTPKISH
jgi:hypothetical protein